MKVNYGLLWFFMVFLKFVFFVMFLGWGNGVVELLIDFID